MPVGPTKVEARRSILFTEGAPKVEIRYSTFLPLSLQPGKALPLLWTSTLSLHFLTACIITLEPTVLAGALSQYAQSLA